MKKRPVTTTIHELAPLITELRGLIHSARYSVATTVNTLQVMTNFEIGRRIVEHEQKGAERAEYGKELLKELSARLTEEFGSGFSERNLRSFRVFYLTYQNRLTAIWQTPSAKLPLTPICQTLSAKSDKPPFTLSWSHYVLLLTIKNPEERSFYEIEAFQSDWSFRELKRQVASGLFERLALSRDKEGVRQLANEGHVIVKPEDILKEPYVLEFLGLDEKSGYSESDMETAIIDQLEQFLLELGKGFLFEARQKRFTFDEDHFFVDLVFYNRLLRCYVIIDLKLDKLSHQDLGQMQMYVNYFDRYPTRTPPSASCFASGRKTPSSNLPCRPTPTSTRGNTTSTCLPRKSCNRNLPTGCVNRSWRMELTTLTAKLEQSA